MIGGDVCPWYSDERRVRQLDVQRAVAIANGWIEPGWWTGQDDDEVVLGASEQPEYCDSCQ